MCALYPSAQTNHDGEVLSHHYDKWATLSPSHSLQSTGLVALREHRLHGCSTSLLRIRQAVPFSPIWEGTPLESICPL